MSQLLDQAFAEAKKLPMAEQDAIAALILQEIEDDRCWEKTLAHGSAKLSELTESVEKQAREGHCRPAGFGEL